MSRILIVDDEKHICEEFQEILQEDGHHVDVAASGPEAIKKVQKHSYDLVFLDVLMPRMEGRETFEKIKSIRAETAVAIMSGYIPAHKEKEIIALGAVACFKKPLDLERVKALIESLQQQKK